MSWRCSKNWFFSQKRFLYQHIHDTTAKQNDSAEKNDVSTHIHVHHICKFFNNNSATKKNKYIKISGVFYISIIGIRYCECCMSHDSRLLWAGSRTGVISAPCVFLRFMFFSTVFSTLECSANEWNSIFRVLAAFRLYRFPKLMTGRHMTGASRFRIRFRMKKLTHETVQPVLNSEDFDILFVPILTSETKLKYILSFIAKISNSAY